jgi:thiamine pyrophosphate-dependent acetolactate synthase large subunit-like protein
MGLSVALGVKHAQPRRPVIVTIGDGAFHYNPVPACFGASQELELPIAVVLFDNAGYLSQKTDVASYFPQGSAIQTGRFAGTAITPRPEYAKLAEAYGGYGEEVSSPAEVAAALERGLEQAQKRLALVHMVLGRRNWKSTGSGAACRQGRIRRSFTCCATTLASSAAASAAAPGSAARAS